MKKNTLLLAESIKELFESKNYTLKIGRASCRERV